MTDLASAIFLSATCLVLYVLAGYPALLELLSALKAPAPHERRHWRPTVTVLLAVRNGAEWIDGKLASIAGLDYPPHLRQVIVIDDGSSDKTAAIALRWSQSRVRVISIPPSGKAAALSAGLAEARGDVVFFTDVRQHLEPGSLTALVEHLADPAVGVVSGELVIGEGHTRNEADVGLYWRYEKWIRRRLSRIDSVIGATGCIYAMKRELTAPLPRGLVLDDVYLPLLAFFAGFRVIFTGDARAFDRPAALDAEFRRKVRTLAGNYQLLRYFPQLLLPTNRMWIHYLSHKLGRLGLPYALLLMACTSPFLRPPFGAIAVSLQLLFCAAAALDSWMPPTARARRLTSPARTFVVMMGAAAAALPVALLGAEQIWRPTASGVGGERSQS